MYNITNAYIARCIQSWGGVIMEWPAGGRGWLVVFPSTCISSHQPRSQWFFNDFRILLLTLSFLLGFCAGYKAFSHAFLLLTTSCQSNQHPSVEQSFLSFFSNCFCCIEFFVFLAGDDEQCDLEMLSNCLGNKKLFIENRQLPLPQLSLILLLLKIETTVTQGHWQSKNPPSCWSKILLKQFYNSIKHPW